MASMTYRRMAITTVVAASALLLAGCSSGTSNSNQSVDLSSKAPTGVTLTMWHNSGDSQALLNLYKAYEKASGNTIDLVDLPTDTFPTAVQTKWATGDRPDILEYMPTPQDMRQLNMSQNMIDLSSLSFVKAEGSLSKVAGSLDGKVYGAVLGPVSTFGAFYNKQVFARAGLKVPTNFTELASDCQTLKAAGATTLSIGGGSEFPANILAFAYMADYNKGDAYGLDVASGKTKVNDPNGPIVAELTAVDNLRKDGCLNSDAATATFDDSIKAVYNGTAAMTILPSDFIQSFYDLDNDNTAAVDAKVGFSAISAKNGVPSYSAGSYGTYYVPSTGNSTKERAAEDFIQWITTKGYQSYVDQAKITPTMSTAKAPKLTGMFASASSMLSNPKATISFNNSIPGFGNFGQIAVSVVAGQSTPQQAADKFQTFVDQAIEAQQ